MMASTDSGFKITHLDMNNLTASAEVNISEMAKRVPVIFTITTKGQRWFDFRFQLCLGLLHLAGWVGPADCKVTIES